MPRVQHVKAKRAALVAKATAGLLLPGEIYLIKDDSPKTLAIATSTTTFDEYYNKSQVNSSVASVLPNQTGNSGKYLTTNGTATSWGTVQQGGLTNFTESNATYSSKEYAKLTPSSASTNVSLVFQPKGTGYFSLQTPDGTTTGGGNRGNKAVDLQMSRNDPAQVASGDYSFTQGDRCAALGRYSFAQGSSCTASEQYSFAQGSSCEALGQYSFARGFACSASGYSSFAHGGYNTASGNYSFAQGCRANSYLLGSSAHSAGQFGTCGDAQKLQLIARGTSSSTTAFDLKLDGSTGNLTLPNYCTWFFVLHLSAMKTNSSALNSYSTLRLGMVARRNNAGSTVVSTYSGLTPDLSVGTFPVPTIALSADTTNGALKITITPTDATSTRWVAVLDICQVGNGASF